MQQIASHPEIERLRRLCEEHRTVIRACLEEWYELTVSTRPRLLEAYHSEFGLLEQQRQRLTLERSELFRRIELLCIKLQRGEKITEEIVQTVNSVVDLEFSKIRRRLEQAQTSTPVPQAPLQRVDNNELVKMYHVLAKKIHPDAVGQSNTSKDWHALQRAYQERDAKRLSALMITLGANDQNTETNRGWSIEQWCDEELRMGVRRRIEERKLARLKREEPFTLEECLDNSEWIARHRKHLEQDIQVIVNELTEKRELFAQLTYGILPAGNVPNKTNEEKVFAEDFMKNTYFGNR